MLIVGGTFALWFGWTVMTIFEFVELLVDVIMVKLMPKKTGAS